MTHVPTPPERRSFRPLTRRSALARMLAAAAVPTAVAPDLAAQTAPLPARRARAGTAGAVMPIGGALRDDNAAVWGRLVELAGGPGARFAVFATGSEVPDESAAAAIANLQRHGALAEHLRVAPRLAGVDIARAVRDPALVERARSADGIFFGGGAQSRILDTLLPQGQPTPLLLALREAHRAGAVFAGTSAGAAVTSDVVFIDAMDPLAVMKGRLREGVEYGRGLGFAPPGLVVDQHFLKRGRIGRLLPLMLRTRQTLGIGVEEGSAAVIADGQIEVVGQRGSLFVDLSQATQDAGAGAFNVRDARLSFLDVGDRLDLATRRVLPSARKRAGTAIDPSVPGFSGYWAGARPFWPDLLGDATILQAMTRLVDSDAAESFGLSFAARPEPDDPQPAMGFEWRLSKLPGRTRGWAGNPGDDYTLQDVRLDVRPVRLAQPLYGDWPRG